MRRKVVFVVRDRFSITRRNAALVITEGESPKAKSLVALPARHIERVVGIGSGSISTSALELMTKNLIDLVILDHRGNITATLETHRNSSDAKISRTFTAAGSNPDTVLRAAHLIAIQKLESQLGAVRRWNTRCSDSYSKYVQAKLAELLLTLACTAPLSRTVILGYEGRSSQLYFSELRRRIRNSDTRFMSLGRSRRPPLDRFNSVLSFTYQLLLAEVRIALARASIDGLHSFLHANSRENRRMPLALDLMEPFRAPLADRTVLRVVNRGQLDPEIDFCVRTDRVHLAASGKRKVIREFERTMCAVHRLAAQGYHRTERDHLYDEIERFPETVSRLCQLGGLSAGGR